MSAEGVGAGGMARGAGAVARSDSLPGDPLRRRFAAAADRAVQNSRATAPAPHAAGRPLPQVTIFDIVRFAAAADRAVQNSRATAPAPRAAGRPLLPVTRGGTGRRLAVAAGCGEPVVPEEVSA